MNVSVATAQVRDQCFGSAEAYEAVIYFFGLFTHNERFCQLFTELCSGLSGALKRGEVRHITKTTTEILVCSKEENTSLFAVIVSTLTRAPLDSVLFVNRNLKRRIEAHGAERVDGGGKKRKVDAGDEREAT